jgi:hypothetical protein
MVDAELSALQQDLWFDIDLPIKKKFILETLDKLLQSERIFALGKYCSMYILPIIDYLKYPWYNRGLNVVIVSKIYILI